MAAREVALFAILFAACSHSAAERLGEPVETSRSVPLSKALQQYQPADSRTVTVSGRITEVCQASGCWFVLEDSSGGRADQIYVDLTHGANFTVPSDIVGRRAVVKGRITGEKPDLKFYAVGVQF